MTTRFNFSYEAGLSLQQIVGIEVAGAIWSNYLQDDITVNIHVGVSSSLPENVIGGALPGMLAGQSYQSVYNRLRADQTSSNDQTATNNLLGGTNFQAWSDVFVNGHNQGSAADTNSVNLTRANAKALNLLDRNASGLDGFIMLGTLGGSHVNWEYDYSRTSGIGNRELDFLSTAVHEIGHILGFVSGIDQPGWLSSSVAGGSSLNDYIHELKSDRINYATPLDFYRFTNQSRDRGMADFSYGSNGGNKFFSIDRGRTALADWSTGLDTNLGGDGQQASHWQRHNSSVMAPTLSTGTRANVTGLDLTAFDVIGWDVSDQSINFKTLHNNVKQRLAAQLNPKLSNKQRLKWMNQTLSNRNRSNKYANQLNDSRVSDINTMIQNSQVYNWGSESEGYWWGTDSDGWWQRVGQIFQQRGLFSTLSEENTNSTPTANSQAISNISTEGFNQPDIPIQWNTVPTDNSVSAADDSTGLAVQAGSLQMMKLHNVTLDLNTPRSFSISRHNAEVSEQQQSDLMADWDIAIGDNWSHGA